MRFNLRDSVGERIQFIARIDHFGVSSEFRQTLLLTNPHNAKTGEYLYDHIWLKATYDIETLKVTGKDIITFWAEVMAYVRDGKIDYGITDVRAPKFATAEQVENYCRWERSANKRTIGAEHDRPKRKKKEKADETLQLYQTGRHEWGQRRR